MRYLSKALNPKRARKWMLAILSLCLLMAGCNAPAAPPTGDLETFTGQLDDQMPKWLQQYQVPGAAVAVVRNGEVVWAKGYGLADKALNVPVTTDTVFQVASISKSVTAWGVMQLVEKGQLDLDAPVEQYLTRWHLPPSDYDANGVTIRRLLSHSAGISLHGYPGLPPDQPLPSLEESLSGNNGGAGDVRIAMEPGAQFSYAGGGYTLLQLVIEEVTGESFSDYMQREILDPLGMSHSSFEWREDLRPATAIGYGASGQPLPNYLFTEKAAAGLYTTAPDLARFVAAEMTGPDNELAGRGILDPATLTMMFTPVIHIGGIEGKIMGGAMGLGHFIETLPDGTKAVSHGGSNQGWQLEFVGLPERGEGIVVLTNSDLGSNLYVNVLGAWSRWLGTGALAINGFYQGISNIALGLAGLLSLGLVFRIWGLIRKVRAGRRQWIGRLFKSLKVWSYAGIALSVLSAVIVALGWYIVVFPILFILAPAQALWLTLAVLGWCLCGVIAALLRPTKDSLQVTVQPGV